MATAEDRIKMECDKCGYKCIPQWLNDKAHCLKCQAVLRTRGSCHETKREVFGAEANGEGRREPGEVSTFKVGPASAMESSSGSCSMSPDGAHHWKYGKCNYCQMAEGKLAKGPGVMANPGGAAMCDRGGKCIFKFAKCTKCGRSEMGGKDVRRPSHEASVTQQRSSEAKPSPKASPQSSPRPQSPLGTVAATLLQSNSKEDVERTPSKEKAPAAGQRNERTRVVCHVCGYKSVPQWMNDRAHCLKCDAVLKTQATIHGSSAMEKERNALRDRRQVFQKTKMCKFHNIGRCQRGAECRFAHDQSELKGLPDLARTKFCKQMIQTGRCEDPTCTYAHNREELRIVPGFSAADQR